MPTTATGPYAATLYNLESLLAASATFKTDIGVGTTEAQARARIYWPGQPEPATIVRPFAVIRLRDGMALTFNHSGAGGGYPTFPLFILLERAYDPADNVKERMIKFLNWVGAIVTDMNAVARTAGYLEVTEFSLSNWQLSDTQEDGLYLQATIELKVFG